MSRPIIDPRGAELRLIVFGQARIARLERSIGGTESHGPGEVEGRP